MDKKYSELQQKIIRVADLKNASAILRWDQKTYMPPNGSDLRAQQLSTLSEIIHQLITEKDVEELLNDIDTEKLIPHQTKNVSLLKEDLIKMKKLPSSFVKRFSERSSTSFHKWVKAYN